MDLVQVPIDILVWNHSIHDSNTYPCQDDVNNYQYKKISNYDTCIIYTNSHLDIEARENRIKSWLHSPAEIAPSLVAVYCTFTNENNMNSVDGSECDSDRYQNRFLFHTKKTIKRIISLLASFVEKRGGHVLISFHTASIELKQLLNQIMKQLLQKRNISGENEEDAIHDWIHPHYRDDSTNNIYSTCSVPVSTMHIDANLLPYRHVGRWIYGTVVDTMDLNSSTVNNERGQLNCQKTYNLDLWNWCFPLFQLQSSTFKKKEWGMYLTISSVNKSTPQILHVEVPFCSQSFGKNFVEVAPRHMWEPIFHFSSLSKEKDIKKRFPKEACQCMNRVYEYIDVQYFFHDCTDQQQRKWMKLYDAFHHLPDIDPDDYEIQWTGPYKNRSTEINHERGIGDRKTVLPVCLTNCKKYEGRYGHIVKFPSFGSGKNVYKVQLWALGPQPLSKVPSLELTASNLKTLGGISRTNSFERSGLFLDFSRINHSCAPNTLKLPLSKYYTYCNQQQPESGRQKRSDLNDKREWAIQNLKCPIPDKLHQFQSFWENAHVLISVSQLEKHDEIFIDYGCGDNESGEFRRDWLDLKYGFTCFCRRCKIQNR